MQRQRKIQYIAEEAEIIFICLNGRKTSSGQALKKKKTPNHLFPFVYLYKRARGPAAAVFNEQLNLWMHFYARSNLRRDARKVGYIHHKHEFNISEKLQDSQ